MMELEPVEPQSLKKLSFKSLKRSLDLFSPVHGLLAPPDPESQKIRLSHKINVEYKGIKSKDELPRQNNSAASNSDHVLSDALALSGPENFENTQNIGSQNIVAAGPKELNANVVPHERSITVGPTPGISERLRIDASHQMGMDVRYGHFFNALMNKSKEGISID